MDIFKFPPVPDVIKVFKRLPESLPTFKHTDIVSKNEIGRGAFATVYTALYHTNQVVLKELHNDVTDDENELLIKEAKLLNDIHHERIVKFLGICQAPPSLMLQYMYFDFKPFGRDLKVNNLKHFMKEISSFGNASPYIHVIPHVATQITEGLNYLHQEEIVHRDIKPANILVSNQHYCNDEEDEAKRQWLTLPISCKLTDFGEGRSELVHTQRLNMTAHTRNIERGTPAFMAPEIALPEKQHPMTHEELKAVDVWALGLIFYNIMNPSLSYPYLLEIRSAEIKGANMVSFIQDMMRKEQKLKPVQKFAPYQHTSWRHVYSAYEACTAVDQNKRPAVHDVLKILQTDSQETCVNRPLRCSQQTALERVDYRMAQILQKGDGTITDVGPPANDGTNACPFLAFKIADRIITDIPGEADASYLATLADDVIWNFPFQINKHRSIDRLYDILETLEIMEKAYLLEARYELSEEIITGDPLFSPEGQETLSQAVKKLCASRDNFVALYTCQPYIFVIGSCQSHPFIIDTHPVNAKLGGNDTGGLVKLYQHSSDVDNMCEWILKRLCGQVDSSANQSLTVLQLQGPPMTVPRTTSPMQPPIGIPKTKKSLPPHDQFLGCNKDISNKESDGRSADQEGNTEVNNRSADQEGDSDIIEISSDKESDSHVSEKSAHKEGEDDIDERLADQEGDDCVNQRSADKKADERSPDEDKVDFHETSPICNEAIESQSSHKRKKKAKKHKMDKQTKAAHDKHMQGTCTILPYKSDQELMEYLDSAKCGMPGIRGHIPEPPSTQSSPCQTPRHRGSPQQPPQIYGSPHHAPLVRGQPPRQHLLFPEQQMGARPFRPTVGPGDVCLHWQQQEPQQQRMVMAPRSMTQPAHVGHPPPGVGIPPDSTGSHRKRSHEPTQKDSCTSEAVCSKDAAEGQRKSCDDKAEIKENEDTSEPMLYKDDVGTPIFSAGERRYTPVEAVYILLNARDKPQCGKVPLRVKENFAFLVNTDSLNNWQDVKNDMNGTFKTPLRSGMWTVDVSDEENVTVVAKRKVEVLDKDHVYLCINSKRNFAGLSRSIFCIQDQNMTVINSVCLLQYCTDNAEEVMFNVKSHGNRKHGNKPFYPTKKSVMDQMKNAVRSNPTAKVYHDMVKKSGGPLSISQPSEIPRDRSQVYQIKSNVLKEVESEDLLAFMKQMENPPVLVHHDYPEDLWVVGTDQMCMDLTRFCTSDLSSFPLSVDPTFNFGQFEVTPFTYRHLFLRKKRTNVPPIFMGPTAIHYSKTETVYRKITSAITDKCQPLNKKKNGGLKKECKGFITDGEVALHNALQEELPAATGLRCVIHFKRNCTKLLSKLGITSKSAQKSLMSEVFDSGGIIDAEDSAELVHRLEKARERMNSAERSILGKGDDHESKFWCYLYKHREMMGASMTITARMAAGIPLNDEGSYQRPTTNQSESLNNILTRKKEAITGSDKKTKRITKIEFIRDVWQVIQEEQEGEVQMALCGMGSNTVLADCAAYLAVEVDTWYDWTPQQRKHYATQFEKLSVEDIFSQREIDILDGDGTGSVQECKCDFSLDLNNALITTVGLSQDLAGIISDESVKLLNCPEAFQKKPSLDGEGFKYLVAGKCKKGMYELTVNKELISCTCPAFRYNSVCKHSLVLAEKLNRIRQQIDKVSKSPRISKPSKKGLIEPYKEAAGKKGGKHKNHWRPARQGNTTLQAPYDKIHHNNKPMELMFHKAEKKAENCRQCGIAFPKRVTTVPFDIAFRHEEKWMYPDPKCPARKIPSCKYTVKYYCVKKECVVERFPYFTTDYLLILPEVQSQLTDSHFKLLDTQFGYKNIQ